MNWKQPVTNYREACGQLLRLISTQGNPEIASEAVQIMADLGRSTGSALAPRFPGATFEEIMREFFRPTLEAGRAEFVQLTGEAVEIIGSTCPLGLHGAGREVCCAAMALDHAALEAASGKKLEMTIKRTVAAGDPVCQIRFAIRP